MKAKPRAASSANNLRRTARPFSACSAYSFSASRMRSSACSQNRTSVIPFTSKRSSCCFGRRASMSGKRSCCSGFGPSRHCFPAAATASLISSSILRSEPASPASFIFSNTSSTIWPRTRGLRPAVNSRRMSSSPGIGSAVTMLDLAMRGRSCALRPRFFQVFCARSQRARAAICTARGSMSMPWRLCSTMSFGVSRRRSSMASKSS